MVLAANCFFGHFSGGSIASSLLYAPDPFDRAFSLTAQHLIVAFEAPQGGLTATPVSLPPEGLPPSFI